MKRIDFYNDGKSFVELEGFFGSDYSILRSARVSTGGSAQKGDKEDRGLIRYLWRNEHSSPFEQTVFTFHFKLPLPIATQLIRHRTFSFNIYSQRYSEAILDCYEPKSFREQGEKNHQGSGPDITDEREFAIRTSYKSAINTSLEAYNDMLKMGVSREMARFVLPEANYTEGYFTVDLRNLFHFLKLRLHEHAQDEIRLFAQAIFDILKDIPEFKWSIEAFEDFTLSSVTLSREELTTIKTYIDTILNGNPDNIAEILSERKVKDVLNKIKVN
jgi:thymidylate synthase (FAD)